MQRSPIPFAALCALLPLAGCNGSPDLESPPRPDVSTPLRVLLEIDHMQGTRALHVEQTIGVQDVDLAAIYRAAGIELTIVNDDADVPAPSPLRLGDLHGIMTTFRDVPQGDADLHIYCLVATQEFGRDDTLGIMFDFGVNDDNDIPREAFAVFSGAHDGMPNPSAEMLLTTAHELAHCFNLHHTDWEGKDFFEDSTVEGYSFTDSVRWALSAQSLTHLNEHPTKLVQPGGDSLPFGTITLDHSLAHQVIPDEGYIVIARETAARTKRGQEIERIQAVRAAASRSGLRRSSRLSLALVPPKKIWQPGEPVTVTAVLQNISQESLDVVPLLDPAFGFLSIRVTRGDEIPVPYHPPLRLNGRNRSFVTLAHNDMIERDCKLFLGSEGWIFDKPGKYVVEAGYTARTREKEEGDEGDKWVEGVEWVQADPLILTVEAPATESASRASRHLLKEGGRAASFQAGLYMYFDGGEHLTVGKAKLEQLQRDYADTAQAAGARYSLGIGSLLPSYDAKRRARPDVKLAEAERYLEDVLESDRAPGEKIFAQKTLTEQLDKAGRGDEADKLRQRTLEEFLKEKHDLTPEQLKLLDYDALMEQKGLESFRKGVREQMRRLEGDGR